MTTATIEPHVLVSILLIAFAVIITLIVICANLEQDRPSIPPPNREDDEP